MCVFVCVLVGGGYIRMHVCINANVCSCTYISTYICIGPTRVTKCKCMRIPRLITFTAKRCEKLIPVDNGKFEILPFNTFGARARYTCGEGYILSGHPERGCRGDGQWDGQSPTCETEGESVYSIGKYRQSTESKSPSHSFCFLANFHEMPKVYVWDNVSCRS